MILTIGCSSQERTQPAPSAALIGSRKARALVPTRIKPNATTAGSPTGSAPDKHSRHHAAAFAWNGESES